MSGAQNTSGKRMASRLAAIELRRAGAAGELAGLSPEHTAMLKRRLLSEKASILAEFDRQSPLRPATNRLKTGIWISTGIAALLLLGIGLTLLRAPSISTETRIAYGKGEVKAADQSLRAGDVAGTGSIISTGATSLTVLHQGEHVTTALASNTGVVIRAGANHAGKPHFELENLNGLVFCSVVKDRATLTIKTATGEIRVIGTSFSVDAGPLGTTVAVLEGTVEVQSDDGVSASRRVPAGERIQIAQKNRAMTSRPLSPAETQALRGLQEFTADAKLTGLADRILKDENILRNQQTAVKLTLAEIRKKYGKISRVNLTNGAS